MGPAGRPEELFTPEAVRQRCAALLAYAEQDRLACLRFHPEHMNAAADFVTAVIRERFPSLAIPPHSRWRHFAAGGLDRQALYPAEPDSRLELCVVSVLLDAGAGPRWRYEEPGTRLILSRSEGLGVASLHAFRAGIFSAVGAARTDAAGLRRISEKTLAEAFQADKENPIQGLAGRAELLRRLGAVLQDRGKTRLSELFGSLRHTRSVAARDILISVLDRLRAIWPRPLGDTWPHPAAGLVPFHKLSQWLSYSLIETLNMEGIAVTGQEALTGLAEYRNGGLFLDTGVLELRDAGLANQPLAMDHPAVVEWRALTVALLDRLMPLVEARLGAELTMAQLLEGGTWEAGRRLAQQRRGDLSAPLHVITDGSVF